MQFREHIGKQSPKSYAHAGLLHSVSQKSSPRLYLSQPASLQLFIFYSKDWFSRVEEPLFAHSVLPTFRDSDSPATSTPSSVSVIASVQSP